MDRRVLLGVFANHIILNFITNPYHKKIFIVHIDELEHLFTSSTVLRLLRSDNAPLVLGFLHRVFKTTEKITIPYSAILEALNGYLEDFSSEQRTRYPNSAKNYLDLWCDEQHQYLRRYYDTGDDPVVELTTETEKVLTWVAELNKQEFVGTESRFLRIFELLQDIIRNTTTDPKVKLADLIQQRSELDREISEINQLIKDSSSISGFTGTQVRERFYLANTEARKLVSDFREVEENFKTITRTIRETAIQADKSKGDILGIVLDADDTLKESDQGKSFYAFWNFLLSPSLQEELKELTDKVYTLPEIEELNVKDRFLQRLKYHLLEAGDKVLRSNHRLADQLRKTIAEKNIRENRRVMELINEIKREALLNKEVNNPNFILNKQFIELDTTCDLDLQMDRPLWSPSAETSFSAINLNEEDEEINLDSLFDQFFIDQKLLKTRINELLEEFSEVSLKTVLDRYTLTKGIPEILGYLTIASKNPKYLINMEKSFSLTLQDLIIKPQGSQNVVRTIKIPEVVFYR